MNPNMLSEPVTARSVNDYVDFTRSTFRGGLSPLTSSPLIAMGRALAATGKHVYAGTVPAAEKARRRAAGKAARVARRVGR